MTEHYQDNMAILRQRWPALAEMLAAQPDISPDAELVQGLQTTLSIQGIQLTSRHDRIAEASLLARKIPKSARSATLFGTALGDVQHFLLKRPALESLKVVILNRAIFRHVLTLSEQRSWLEDPRVELVFDGSTLLRPPLATVPGEVMLAERACEGLRDRLMWQMNEERANQIHSADNPEVRSRFRELLPLIKSDTDVATLFNTLSASAGKAKVLVIATGPSLQFGFERIRQARQNAIVIAVDTALKPLLDAGITPDYVVTIDARITAEHLQVERVGPVPLIYFPRIAPAELRRWPGERIAAVWEASGYDVLARKAGCGRVYSSGSVTLTAVDLAVKMGATDIALFGCDFAYPNGQTHTGYEDGELGASARKARYMITGCNGELVATEPNMAMYLRTLEDYICRHPGVRFTNMGEIGALIKGTLSLKEAAA
ncbi:DUF115 domain-containing protein [Marinobacter hydrocarbonoclasticus]|nr:DUF115 domain-containing protein [Marinobacter nauticus]